MPDSPATWSLLLAQWTAFAKASLALPVGAEGDRWRAAVSHIIALQAVTFALGDLGGLSAAERAVALDKAELLIRRHARSLHALWRAEPLPEELDLLLTDARAALSAVWAGGLEWRVAGDVLIADHPAPLAEAMVAAGFRGDLFMPVPGVPLFRSSPAAFLRMPDGGTPPEDLVTMITGFLGEATEPRPVPEVRQVYRQFDFGLGRPVRDRVVPLEGSLPAGQPLLAHVVEAGRVLVVPFPPRAEIREPLPVVFADEAGISPGQGPQGGDGA